MVRRDLGCSNRHPAAFSLLRILWRTSNRTPEGARLLGPCWKSGSKILYAGIILPILTGCLSPIAMHRAVLEYDRTVSYVEADLLLLNIARAAPPADTFHRSLQRRSYVRFPDERRHSGGHWSLN